MVEGFKRGRFLMAAFRGCPLSNRWCLMSFLSDGQRSPIRFRSVRVTKKFRSSSFFFFFFRFNGPVRFDRCFRTKRGCLDGGEERNRGEFRVVIYISGTILDRGFVLCFTHDREILLLFQPARVYTRVDRVNGDEEYSGFEPANDLLGF